MKYSLSIFILLSFLFQSYSQKLEIKNDSILKNSNCLGIIKSQNGKKIAFFENLRVLDSNCSWVRSFDGDVKKCKVDKYILTPLLFFNDLTKEVTRNDLMVGNYKVQINDGSLPIMYITIFSSEFQIEYVKYCAKKSFPSNVTFKIKYDYSREKQMRIERNKLIARNKIIKERQRIERFYAQVYDKLGGDLDNIEGIYKSVDQGESFEYDIAIFKSYENNREYVGLILSTTDSDLSIGGKIFTFEKTAQANLFFGKYKTKGGTSFENKTASLNGAILKMGVKSFIKMYPAEGETRQYREINPMVDWQSSGSGVLINNNGYIATNNHVIKGAEKIRISFQNDSIDYEAKIISQNEENDVAIVQITDSRFKSAVKPVKWNSSVSLGEKVFTLGYPISNKMSDNVKVVDGIVSGLNGREGNKAFFQTTLPVWYGNSGGPCFNSKGEILGLATQILWDKGEKVDNVAYITKTSNVLSLANSIITKENISSAGLNEVELQNLIKKLIPYSAFIKVNY